MTETTNALRIRLPGPGNALEEYFLESRNPSQTLGRNSFQSRVAFAAAHVVVDPLQTADPINDPAVDFSATLAYRRYLWSLGFGVAEAMDTAQRGSGLNWTAAKELIRLSCAEAKAEGGAIACGANTDHLDPLEIRVLSDAVRAYEEQCEYIESCGGQIILMASRGLARIARTSDEYRYVYSRILSQVSSPVILHWLGEAFDPALRGYWGGPTTDACMEICLQLMHDFQSSVDGIKISLLDKEREVEMRRRLPSGVRMYTGDDFHYPELIEGDDHGYSDALLGIFDAIAPAASLALQALDAGHVEQYRTLLDPTLPLSKLIFASPTYHYKTGIVFIAYLNGHQNHFHMLGGQQSARSVAHLALLFRLADQASLLADPDLAVLRMQNVLALAGVC